MEQLVPYVLSRGFDSRLGQKLKHIPPAFRVRLAGDGPTAVP